MSDGHFPDESIIKYLPIPKSKHICLLDDMQNMREMFQEIGYSVGCNILEELYVTGGNKVPFGSVNVAFLTNKNKVDYVDKLYSLHEPFVLIMPTSCLGLTGLGKYFREKGISFHVLPETIFCRKKGEKRNFKPPYTLSLFSYKCVLPNLLEIL